MANAIKWEAAFTSQGTVLGTELNSLADGSRTDAGTEFDNSTGLHQFGRLLLDTSFASAPSSGAYVGLYMLSALDGTNYEEGGSGTDPGEHTLVDFLPIRAGTGDHLRATRIFVLPPCKLKFILRNKTGRSFPSSGSTLTLYTANDEVQ